MAHDPLHGAGLAELRRLREQLAASPNDADRSDLAQATLAALLATRPVPQPALSWRWRLALPSVVLAVAAVGYGWKGSFAGWSPAPPPNPAEAMVQRLAERLAAAPDTATPEAWAMLGRSQTVLGRLPEAASAYRQALRLGPDAPDAAGWRADLADLLATTQNGQFAGEPTALIADALQRAPRQPKALALAAAAAWQRGERDAARAHWRLLLEVAPPGDPLRASAEQGLAQP